jgi:hypothetical protein
MRYKVGVTVPKDLDPRMLLAHAAVERAWDFVRSLSKPVEIGYEATITSWGDSVHGANSYHKRQGRAIDVRTKTISRPYVQTFVDDLKRRIGALGFDIVLEDSDGPMEHLHLELDDRAEE